MTRFWSSHLDNMMLLKSEMPIWQIPSDVYRQMSVSLSELQLNVEPCGAIGKYLFEQMLEVNEDAADIPYWPNGETWGLGDSPTIGVFLEDPNNPELFEELSAPTISYEDMSYSFDQPGRKIRVYHKINSRLILDDMFAKLKINFML